MQTKPAKDPHIKGRKYNGRPYLRLKRVKEHPRQKIRQLLRSFMPSGETRRSPDSESAAG